MTELTGQKKNHACSHRTQVDLLIR